MLVFLLLLPLSSAFADILDYAYLLSQEEEDNLEDAIEILEDSYGIGLYIVTLNDKSDIDADDYDMETIAEFIYEDSDFGIGDDREGVMLFVELANTGLVVYPHGPVSEALFTDNTIYDLTDVFLDGLDESFYSGCYDYLSAVEDEFIWVATGEYPSSGSDSSNRTTARTRSSGRSAPTGSSVTESVMDYANLLSDTERSDLVQRIKTLQEQYTITVDGKSDKVGIYIITLPNKELIGAESYQIYDLSEALYEAWECGLGNEKTGILLLMDMYERDFDICAHGTAGHYTFTDYGKEKLEESFSEDFHDDYWYGGFNSYLDEIERQLSWAEKGEPVDVHSESEKLRTKIGIPGIVGVSFLIGIFIAFLICSYFKNAMKSVRPAASASNFVDEKGIEYTQKLDDYLRTTTTTRVIESSSSKGGTSVNSRGYSHHSGKF